MRWKDERRSENVEDRRGIRPAGIALGGLGTLIVVLIGLWLGADPRQLMRFVQENNPPGGAGAPAGKGPTDPAEEERVDFVKAVLGDTEDVWTELFRKANKTYVVPHLVLFTGRTSSACGFASAAVGPFYCPGDQKVYIDLAFYKELAEKFKAPGEFAQAYVIAHEIGHHVQNLLGTSEKVHALQQRVSKTDANQLSVRLELQADFLAGVWAHHAHKHRDILEPGDVETALRAAAAIGDDRLQKQSQGYVVPDSFTHGSSEQRVRWFRRGLETGDISQGDTFDSEAL
jgi:predicted metalloprotease